MHCLLGDNGAGKSTLIKTLAGVHQPSDGRVSRRRPAGALQVAARCARPRHRHRLPGSRAGAADVRGAQFLHGARAAAQALRHLPGDGPRLAGQTARDRLADMGIRVRDAEQLVGTHVRRRKAVPRDRARDPLRRARADPRRADRGARREAERQRAEADRTRRASAASPSSSSRTTCTTPTRSATRSRCSTAAKSMGTLHQERRSRRTRCST